MEESARVAAERIRQLVNALNFSSSRQPPFKVTISIGISGFPSEQVKNFKDLITLADKALYRAKASGRDRIALAEEPLALQVSP